MVHLIDKDAVVAEIQKLHSAHSGKYGCDEVGINLEYLEDFLGTLEVKEVDLQKEINKEWEKCNPIDEGMGVESAYVHIEAFDMIARHFFELGLKVQKGE